MTAELYALLERLNKAGLTIIMISHDIMSAVKYGNKVLQLATKPLFFGSTSEYVKTRVYAKMTETAHDETHDEEAPNV
jgi:zinc transport system ATP-binding protein